MSDKEKISDAYKNLASDLLDIESKDKEKRKEVLKDGVLDLEQKYKDEIKGTHAVDERLVKLRKEAGMPELIGVGEKVQRKRFKDKEKFDQFLAKEVLEVGIEETRKFGGVSLLKDFCTIFAEKRPNWEASKSDIQRALENLAIAGLIPKLYKMKKGDVLVTFKPAELEEDLLIILNIASANGTTTKDEVISLLGWQKERVELAFLALLEEQLAYFDSKEKIYHFPSLKK
ncbi:MAG: hypothetical protein FK734_10560 [Asgard group archaeon]|nr:hypothetical protein [Asgard group archaeon]